jgi:outer membrane protein OmpA-like peptidoglycan-associated protein
MTSASRAAAAIVMAGAAVQFACAGNPRPSPGATQPGTDLVVLLPDADGTVGAASVSNRAGATDLSEARASTRVSPGQAPTPAAVLSEDDAQRLFGRVLEGLPPAPRHFTLHFRFESDELTDESRLQVEQILRIVEADPGAEVAVVGHTDTSGTPARNHELGLSRARRVREILVAARVDPSAIEVRSHGEGDLAVQTGDDVFEPRNRRVEITVR